MDAMHDDKSIQKYINCQLYETTFSIQDSSYQVNVHEERKEVEIKEKYLFPKYKLFCLNL